MFGFFQAESFDYSGSGRFVKDMASFECKSRAQHSNCPFFDSGCSDPCISSTDFQNLGGIESIEGVLDMSHLMSLSSSALTNASFYMHTDSMDTPGVSNIMNLLGLESAWDGNSERRLPPSTLHSWLKYKRSIPGITIGDYKEYFSNRNFNSEADRWASDVDMEDISSNLCTLANAIAATVYRWANSDLDITELDAAALPSAPASLRVNCSLVSELLNCYIQNPNCTLFREISPANGNEFSTYQILEAPSYATSFYDYITFFLAHNATGYPQAGGVNNTAVNCTVDSDCDGLGYRCVFGSCMGSSAYTHPAYGPGIEYDTKAGSFYVADGRGMHATPFLLLLPVASWTQSTFSGYRLRLFILESDIYSGSLLAASLVSFIAAVLISRATKGVLVKHKVKIM